MIVDSIDKNGKINTDLIVEYVSRKTSDGEIKWECFSADDNTHGEISDETMKRIENEENYPMYVIPRSDK
jgi:hypothetical protein